MRKKPLLKMEEVVCLLFEAALDQLYSVTPLRAPEGCAMKDGYEAHYIDGVMNTLGTALGIIHVKLTGEGLDERSAVLDFRLQFEAAYDISWRDNGERMFKRMKKKKMPCPTSELLLAWPSAEEHAKNFLAMCEE